MPDPFLGTEALAAGSLSRHQLRTRHRLILPGVYFDRTAVPTLHNRTVAAWLWSRREGVIGGAAAAAMLGAKWVDSRTDIDVFCANTRPPAGITVHYDKLAAVETRRLRGIRVTTAARTGFDLARHRPVNAAVAAVDALLNVTGIDVAAIEAVATHHRGARGLRQLERVLGLVDAGADHQGAWLRLLIRRNRFPPPETQIEVRDQHGDFVARLDMGWSDLKVAVEYDGDQHRSDRRQYVRDMRRLEELDRLGWVVIRVVAEDVEVQIVRRIQHARELQASRFTQRRRIE